MLRVQPIVLQSSPVAGRRSAPAVQPKRMSSRSKQASRLPVSAPAPVLAALSPSAASTLSPARNPKRCPNIPYNDLLATHDAVSFLVNAPTLPPALALQPPQIRPPSRARTLSSIPQLREAISDIDSRVAALLDERARLEFSLEQAVRLQAPIQRLPNELLSSIFSIGVADDEEPLAPWTIMLVCRQWVSVARDTPTLWSRIVVSPQHSLTHARLCLARSKTVPVDISIAFDPRSESPGASSSSVEIVARALDLFVPQMWRWRSFHLAVPGPAQAHDALARCASPAPLLSSLKIRIFSSFQDEDVRLALPPALLASSAPRLRECTLHSLSFDWTARTASLAGLRVLDIGGYWSGVPPTVQKILDVLRQCPGIEEFALRHMPDIDQESSDRFAYEPLCGARIPLQTIPLPRLHKATFDYAGVQRTRAVLSQLTFPSLEEIEFCYVENLSLVMPHLNRQALTSLPLRRLRIEQGSCAEKDLLRFLAWAPGLTTLELIDVEGISSSLLHIMAQPAQHTWICPSLETLLLDGCTTLTFEALRSFVESRLSPHARAYPHTATPSWTVKPQTSRRDIYLSHDDGPARTPRSSRSAPALCRSQSTPPQDAIDVSGWPRRLRRLGLARCHQFSREMLQRLQMYVPDVKLGAAYDPTSS